MAEESRFPAIIDTSVLLNFLAIDQAVLLSRHPCHRFLITDHVCGEVTDERPERLSRFERALEDRLFEAISVSDPAELQVYGNLIATGRLGDGECAAAAVAIVRSLPLATDDAKARKLILRGYPSVVFMDTPSIMRDLIASGVLSVELANRLKTDLEANHRFKMSFESFVQPTLG